MVSSDELQRRRARRSPRAACRRSVTVWPTGSPVGEQLVGGVGPEHDDGGGVGLVGGGDEPARGHRRATATVVPRRRGADQRRGPVGRRRRSATPTWSRSAATAGDVGGDASDGQRLGVARWSASTPSRTRRARPVAVGACCPGETTSRLVPSSSICSLTSAWAPWPRPTVRMTAVMPIRMPEHRQRRPQPVRADGVARRCGRCRARSSHATALGGPARRTAGRRGSGRCARPARRRRARG